MKTTFLLAAALVLSVAGNSQTTPGASTKSGRIYYEERIKIPIHPDGDKEAHSIDEIPKERISRRVLYFNSEYSLYEKDDRKGEEVMRPQKSHISMRMISSGENDKMFCDLYKMKRTEQKEFMTRTFLIEGEKITSKWKLTGESRTVSGYNCQEAVREDSENKVSAWFTPSVPVSAGPAGYEGLPGIVLLVEVNNGEKIIVATSIDTAFDVKSKLSIPKEGKKVTSKEFDKIVDEKLKELGNEESGGGRKEVIQIMN